MLALTRSLTLAWPQVGQLKHTPPLACEPRRGVHFSCPTCGADLLPVSEGVRSLRCSAGHVVDIAREGHLHLLPPKRVKGAVQEARDEVARSSRAFFEHGGFSAQLDGVAAEVVRAIGCCWRSAPANREVRKARAVVRPHAHKGASADPAGE